MNQLAAMGPEELCFVFSVMVAYGVRRFNFIANKWIYPLCVLVGLVSYLFSPPIVTTQTVARKFMLGTVISLAGGLVAMALHQKAFAALAQKWPWLGFLIADDTTPTSAPQPENPIKPPSPPDQTVVIITPAAPPDSKP